MGRRPIIPFGTKGPWILGALALGLLVYGLITGSTGLVVVGAVGAAALLIGFPLAELMIGRERDSEE
jgi:MFS superfamily sulfate permease-like transporter